MRITLSEALESPVAAAIFTLGVIAAAVAIVFGDGEFDADPGSPLFLVGVVFAAFAVLGFVVARRRS
jgi:type IV secretory pathway VirB2 component (pilin)